MKSQDTRIGKILEAPGVMGEREGSQILKTGNKGIRHFKRSMNRKDLQRSPENSKEKELQNLTEPNDHCIQGENKGIFRPCFKN